MNKAYIFLGISIIISILLTLSLLIVLMVSLSTMVSEITEPLTQLNAGMENFQTAMQKNVKETNSLLRVLISEMRNSPSS